MKILGIIGRNDSPLAHDGAAALVVDHQIVYAIEQERLTRSRYAMGQGAELAIEACLKYSGYNISDLDHIAYGWLPQLSTSQRISDQIVQSEELNHVIIPDRGLAQQVSKPVHFVQHHYAHAASTFHTSGFSNAAILVIDGRGEGESISLYHADLSGIRLLESYPMEFSLGVFYSAAASCAGIGGIGGHSGPGKLMGLAPFGQKRQEIDFHFNSTTGRFTLPKAIQERVLALNRPPNAGEMWQFWSDYFRDHFYPYSGPEGPSSLAYDITQYVDLAATVQQKFEEICQALTARIKKMTHENNLALSGGCALNCSMNAYLDRQRSFENLYVFPGANDAGTSMGAALALAHTLQPLDKPSPRLVAPDFGNMMPSDQAIQDAIDGYGLIPKKLSPHELAEQVALDLQKNKIIAWYQGRDEFGPRALGRRSFLTNPAHRENLGRLNKIKGREMWRPLAPSILEDSVEEVLEGSLEPGLHRYMLGVATIRPKWRSKIPAVVHIDFTCRPHFVSQHQDDQYWAVIERFYKLTGIPLVCNTSLNVAGQPIVHRLSEVIELFIGQQDVQTLVVGEFYLTKGDTIFEIKPQAENRNITTSISEEIIAK